MRIIPLILHVLSALSMTFPGVPRLTEDSSAEELSAVRKAADLFQLPYLTTICDNIEREEEFLNPSIGTFHNDETAAKMKELFFNKSTLADVVFLLQGEKNHQYFGSSNPWIKHKIMLIFPGVQFYNDIVVN